MYKVRMGWVVSVKLLWIHSSKCMLFPTGYQHIFKNQLNSMPRLMFSFVKLIV